jgi:hypothetical protein
MILWKCKHLRWAGTCLENKVSLNRLGFEPSHFRHFGEKVDIGLLR